MRTCALITLLLWCYLAKANETHTTKTSNLTKKLPTPTKETFSTKPSVFVSKPSEILTPSPNSSATIDRTKLYDSLISQKSLTKPFDAYKTDSPEVKTVLPTKTLHTISENEQFNKTVQKPYNTGNTQTVLESQNTSLKSTTSASLTPDKIILHKTTLSQKTVTVVPDTVKMSLSEKQEASVGDILNKSKTDTVPVISSKEVENNTQKPQPIKVGEKLAQIKIKVPAKLKSTDVTTASAIVKSLDRTPNKTLSITKKPINPNKSSYIPRPNNKSHISTAIPPKTANSTKDVAVDSTGPNVPKKASSSNNRSVTSGNKSISQHSASEIARFPALIINSLQERADALGCDLSLPSNDLKIWRGNQTQELMLPMTTPENCPQDADCLPMIFSWEGYAEIQSGDVLLVRIDDKQLMATESVQNITAVSKSNDRDEKPHHSASQTAVYQVTRPGHANCDVTEGILLDITPLLVDGKKLVTLYDKDLTEGVNLLIVVSELWGNQCIRLNVTVKSDNCGENQDCSLKGLCFSNTSMESYECQCCAGFIGPHCEERDACHLSPCTNNGICVDVSQGPEGSTYQCLCPYGFSGLNCEYEYNECDSSPCMNEAICSDLINGFSCLCKQGYMGQRCEIKVDLCNPDPCPKNRLCIDHGNNFSCECPKGLYGIECLQPTRAACNDNICANGGTCWSSIDSFYCACRPGYTGKVCEDEFIVEAVAGQDVVLGPHQNHFHNNIYVAAGTLCLAITIVALVVAACHCRVNKTYRKLLQKAHPLLRQRSSDSEMQNDSESHSHQHWLTEKPMSTSRPLDYDMFYALDFGESQSSPLIQ